MPDDQRRRRFLQLTGTGLAASVAGCSDAFSMGDDNGGGDGITAIVQPSQEDFADAMDEEMSQEEARQRERELFEEAVGAFEDRADESQITIEESTGEAGLFLIDGAPEAILDGLVNGNIFTLHDGDAYDILLEQSQGGQQGPPTDGDPEEGDEADDEDGGSEGGDEDAGDEESDSEDEGTDDEGDSGDEETDNGDGEAGNGSGDDEEGGANDGGDEGDES